MSEYTDLIDIPEVTAEPVVFDYEATKARLEASLAEYQGIEVTADSLSICKRRQKDLASMRLKLDNAKKDIKRKWMEPLDIFEEQMISLIAMVKETEEPLKKKIDEYDQKVRDEHIKYARETAAELAKEAELDEEFTSQIEIKKRFSNLGIKESEIRRDLELQVEVLKEKQKSREATIDMIKKTVERENESITAKMKPEWFLADLQYLSAADIVAKIMDRARDIRETEEEVKRQEEAKRLEEEARRQAEMESQQEDLAEEPPSPQEDPVEETPIPQDSPVEEPTDYNIYRVVYVVTGTREQVMTLSRFLKDNHYSYEVDDQRPIGKRNGV